MIRIRYTRASDEDVTEVWLDGSVRAVAAGRYAHIDEGQGGITLGDLDPDDVVTLDQFNVGDEVFVESEEPDDVLDDTGAASTTDSRIWWRATVLPPRSR